MNIGIVAALDQQRGIGKNNALPWRLKDDLAFFKKLTIGHSMVMGRKTFESLPGLLPGRAHLVLSSREIPPQPGLRSFDRPEELLGFLQAEHPEKEIFVIGGGQIYELFLPIVQTLYLSIVDACVEADTFFPYFSEEYREAEILGSFKKDERNEFAFEIKKFVRK